jgi:hypothetical protein
MSAPGWTRSHAMLIHGARQARASCRPSPRPRLPAAPFGRTSFTDSGRGALVRLNLPVWREAGGVIGAGISGTFLCVIGTLNLVGIELRRKRVLQRLNSPSLDV